MESNSSAFVTAKCSPGLLNTLTTSCVILLAFRLNSAS